MKAIRNWWNALPWYYQVPLASVIGPPLMIVTIAAVIVGSLPAIFWIALDDAINNRGRNFRGPG